MAAAATRLLAVAGVGAFGVAALTATSDASVGRAGSLPVTVAAGSLPGGTFHAVPQSNAAPVAGTPPTAASPAHPAAKPAAAAAQPQPAPAPAGKPADAKPASAPATWTPQGTGMWIYQWRDTAGGDAARIIHRAKGAGLSTLYLRTGSSWDGLDNVSAVRSLLHVAHGSAVHVVAWDFPNLWRPVRDARRLAAAARIRDAQGDRVSAVAPDIETPNEGTYNAAWRVKLYLQALRRALPDHVAILTAVPWPSSYRIADYPYQTVAHGSNVLIPMAYWYNNPPTMVTAQSIGYLRQFGKPVEPVGQGYDGSVDVRGIHNNLTKQIPAFLHTAHAQGARAVSLWSWQAAPQSAWHALSKARHLFAATPGHS
jgi:hypothetical protein